jgi:hypothetical protein
MPIKYGFYGRIIVVTMWLTQNVFPLLLSHRPHCTRELNLGNVLDGLESKGHNPIDHNFLANRVILGVPKARVKIIGGKTESQVQVSNSGMNFGTLPPHFV